jgi:hypothetical protein
MYSSINPGVIEVNELVERLRARTDLLPLKARGLKRFAAELKAISEIGLPWKAVWRILRDVGYASGAAPVAETLDKRKSVFLAFPLQPQARGQMLERARPDPRFSRADSLGRANAILSQLTWRGAERQVLEGASEQGAQKQRLDQPS